MTAFALPIFLGAFLLFQVQPLIAKFILPWFGGSPAVWTTCMLFFQVFLLAGYAYAHGTTRFLSARRQALLHGVLLLAALAFLPIIPGAQWKPHPGDEPTWRILLLLAACLGLPYLVLAATSPLLQAWFSRLHPERSPYRLYSLSNVGSLLALVSYPFVVEPALTRQTQASVWAWSFVGFVLLCGGCGWKVWKSEARNPKSEGNPKSEAQNRHPEVLSPTSVPLNPQPSTLNRYLWFLLSMCGSVLLLGITNKLCQQVAAVPFLWVLPLSVYLLTFVLCFDHPAWYARRTFTLLLVVMLALLCWALVGERWMPVPRQILLYCGSLFVFCMVCHGEVHRVRPAPRYLTAFYLSIAAGGAAGGLFVAGVAPLVFKSYAELNWGLWLLAALVWWIHARDRTAWRLGDWRLPWWPALGVGVAALTVALVRQVQRTARDAVFTSRNFYGVLQVVELAKGTAYHASALRHGYSMHGLQFTDPALAAMPTIHYHELGGVGLAVTCFPRQANRRLGVVGLGVGTLAAYGQPGDVIRFYEINPGIWAEAENRFTYLKNCRGQVGVVLGDARLSLENEPPQQFDLLVLDAFTSDAIPAHLLTREAFDTYLRHLKPDGAMVVHSPTSHYDMFALMRGVATHFQLGMVCIERKQESTAPWVVNSSWVLLSRNQQFLNAGPILKAASASPTNSVNELLWTDDHASLFRILKARR